MSKVALVAVSAKYVHCTLSVWVLAAGVCEYARIPHDIEIIEANINQPVEEIAGRVANRAPDVVGISAYIWNAKVLPELIGLIKVCLPSAVIVLGGPEASYNAEYWLKTGADYVQRGEGERAFPAFLDCLSQNSYPENIPGLCYIKGGKFTANPENVYPDHWTDPYTDDFFASLGGRIAYIETSRGCPFKCTFCLSGGSGARFLPIDAAKNRLSRLSESGAGRIKLVDRTFNCDSQRAYNLFEYIIGLKKGCFHFEVAPDLFDQKTISLLKTAPPGRVQLEAGLQSFHLPALEASSRKVDLQKSEDNIRKLLSGGNIHIHVDLIAGLPYETLADFKNSFERAWRLGAHTLQLGFLKMLHGSAMREKERSIIFSKEPPYEITQNPWLSEGDIKTLKIAENALQSTHNKSRFLKTLGYVLAVSGAAAFELFFTLGKAAPNHATPLENYAESLYKTFKNLPNIEDGKMRESMIYDWLSMVKGKNMPRFLRIPDNQRELAAQAAQNYLGRRPGRHETALLPSGKRLFVDINDRHPVTGLYRVRPID
jgi:radical SAM superfamily enzyme YgiQ (UPF0313 family)